jgi:CheY-like chemotaxis protein
MPTNDSKFNVIRIAVADTGIGIAAEDIPKLFKPFERVGAENTATEGTGLGLAVVKKLIDAMGGQLGVESELGIGSTFWIELPQCESQWDALNKSFDINGLGSVLSDKKGTILYIEDNFSNIELVEQTLTSQRAGIRLITNSNGKQTLNLAVEQKPDLILLDLNLPDIHGSDVIDCLQKDERTRSIPVVVISADAMPQQIERLLEAGAKRYITKPLDLSVLLKIVDEFVVV